MPRLLVVTWRDRFRAMRMDVTPLRESRDFRLLFLAGTVFYLGGMVTYVAIPFQIYHLTGSNFAVGAVGLVAGGVLLFASRSKATAIGVAPDGGGAKLVARGAF